MNRIIVGSKAKSNIEFDGLMEYVRTKDGHKTGVVVAIPFEEFTSTGKQIPNNYRLGISLSQESGTKFDKESGISIAINRAMDNNFDIVKYFEKYTQPLFGSSKSKIKLAFEAVARLKLRADRYFRGKLATSNNVD